MEEILALTFESLGRNDLIWIWEGSENSPERLIDASIEQSDGTKALLIVQSCNRQEPQNVVMSSVVEAVTKAQCGLVVHIFDLVQTIQISHYPSTDWRPVFAGSLAPYVDDLADRYTSFYRHNLVTWLLCDQLCIEDYLGDPNDHRQRRALLEQLEDDYGWRKALHEGDLLLKRLQFLDVDIELMTFYKEIFVALSQIGAIVDSKRSKIGSADVEALHGHISNLIKLATPGDR